MDSNRQATRVPADEARRSPGILPYGIRATRVLDAVLLLVTAAVVAWAFGIPAVWLFGASWLFVWVEARS